MNQVHEYFLGIDVSKHKLDVALLRMGKTRSKVVSNTAEGYAQLEAWLRAQGATAEATHVCLESTGSYGEGVSFRLSDAGWYVSVVNPAQVTGFAQGELKRNKTDHNDAISAGKVLRAHASRAMGGAIYRVETAAGEGRSVGVAEGHAPAGEQST